MLPLAVVDRFGAIIRDDGELARVIALDSPNALLLGDVAAAKLSAAVASLLEQVCAAGAPLQLHIRGVAAPSTGAPRSHGLAIDTHLVCSRRFPAGGSLSGGGGRALVRHRARNLRDASAQSFEFARAVAGGLGRLGFGSRVLDGVETADLIARRLAPATDAPRPVRPLEVAGTFDETADLRAGARLARELRTQLERVASIGPRQVRIGDDIEHVYVLAGVGQATSEGWLEPLVEAGVAFTLSVHLALARDSKRRREARDRSDGLLASTYLALRVAEGSDTPGRAVETLERLSACLSGAAGAPLHRGDFRQAELWAATLPIGSGARALGDQWPAGRLAGALPLLRVTCGSPTGIPIGRSPAGAIERLDPWDPHHRTAGLLLAGGGAADRIVENLITGLAGGGVRAVTISTRRPGPSAAPRHIAPIHSDGPPSFWSVDRPFAGAGGKVAFLTGLYSQALNPAGDLEVGHRRALRDAIERVLDRAAEGRSPASGAALAEQLAGAGGLIGDADRGEGHGDAASRLAERIQRLGAVPGHEWVFRDGTARCADADWLVCEADGPELVALLLWIAAEHMVCSLARAHRAGTITGGALVIDDADLLLANPESAAWLARLVGSARRRGLVVIAACREPVTLTTLHARRTAKAFSIVTLACAKRAEHDGFAQMLALGEAPSPASAADLDRPPADGVYWVNGGRGRGFVVAPEGPEPHMYPTRRNDAP